MAYTAEILVKWVMLVKMEMVLSLVCRPALAAGGVVSRATLRQRETRESAARFASERSTPEFPVCETDERFVFLLFRGLVASASPFSATPVTASYVDRIHLLVVVVFTRRPLAPNGVDGFSLLAEIQYLESLFANLLQCTALCHRAQGYPDVLREHVDDYGSQQRFRILVERP